MFLSTIFNKLLLRNHDVNFVEICNVCARRVIIKAAKRIINFDKKCRSYSDLNFGVTFLEHSVVLLLFKTRRINMHNTHNYKAQLLNWHICQRLTKIKSSTYREIGWL